MTFGKTSRALFALLFVTACPVPVVNPDASVEFDAGNPPAKDACSGGCAANQRCDTAKRECVDACGGCDAGTCVKMADDSFQCAPNAVTCGSATCAAGQIACVGGACSCLAAANASGDTCRGQGQWCSGSACSNPKRFEQCVPGSGTAGCPSGHVCEPVFGPDKAICVKVCGTAGAACDRGEFCASLSTGAGCLPAGLFRDQECNQYIPLDDGGVQTTDGGGRLRVTVPVSNTCLLKDNNGNVTDVPGLGSGNCSYALFKFWDDGTYPFTTCRPPGTATEGQACKKDYTAGTVATQCATGLECALTSGSDQGVCLRMCNANPAPPGVTLKPSCHADEACVNLYRYTDPSNNAVLGVCMKQCDVFNAAKNSCANVGTSKTSCVPTTASGEAALSAGGAGICVPQRSTVAATGATCAGTDPFKGASCGSGELCTSTDLGNLATCTKVCDVDCANDGGTLPARCATEVNAQCGAGTTCRRVSSTSGARLGFCQ